MRIRIAAAALIGLTIDAAFGVKQGVQFSRSLDEGELIFVSHATAEFAAKQFKYADGAHAREAAVLQIKVLQSLRRAGHDSSDEKQLGWAYVRLAMIEESVVRKKPNAQLSTGPENISGARDRPRS